MRRILQKILTKTPQHFCLSKTPRADLLPRYTLFPRQTTRVMSTFKYPETRRDSSMVEVLHGQSVPDPYRFLEDPDSEETKAFVDAQNTLFQDFIKKNSSREKLQEKLTEMFNYERYGCPFKSGDNYYYFHNSGLQAQAVLYTQTAIDAPRRTFFDPNTLSEDGTISLNTYGFSKSGKYFAYGLSSSGSDWVQIHVKGTGEGDKDLEEKPLEWAKFTGIRWTHDDQGFFYSRYPTPDNLSKDKAGTETDKSKFHKLVYHRVGTPQSEDIICLKDDEHPDRMFSGQVSDDGRYLIVTLSESCDPQNLVYICDLEKQFGSKSLKGVPEFTKIVDKWEAEFSYLTNEGSVFYFETTLKAPKKRIVKYNLEQPDLGFVDVVPESKDVLSISTVVNNNKLIIAYLQDVKHVIKLFDLSTGKPLAPVDLPLPIGSIIRSITGRKEDSDMFYSFASWLSPGVIYRYDFSKMEQTVFRETQVKGYDSSKFQTEQVFYPSKDGTKVPMYIISRKDTPRNSKNPTLLYAYGGFNISILPSFSVAYLTFIEKFHGVVAVANIRGGSEYGEEWYKSGRLELKQNCFTDFQHAAQYLCSPDCGYTNPSKLSISGGSNGGLLVAACVNQAPELFRCAIADVGVHDCFRFHKFTIGKAWVSDFGDPDKAEDFEYIKTWSPLHNVRGDRPHPAILLTTGDHDDRVVPLHSLKLIATLQHEVKNNALPIMARIDTKAGHGAGKSTKMIIEEITDKYTFMTTVLDAEWKDE